MKLYWNLINHLGVNSFVLLSFTTKAWQVKLLKNLQWDYDTGENIWKKKEKIHSQILAREKKNPIFRNLFKFLLPLEILKPPRIYKNA